MPFIPYKINEGKVSQLKRKELKLEKELQNLIENNLPELFGVAFLASEYSTGERHGGRMDTLGIDENYSPVILEYKKNKNQNIINQSLFYLDWLVDHKGAFELLVRDKFEEEVVVVDWSSPRVLCIAEEFNKYDTYAVEQMKRPIELIQYRVFEDNIFALNILTAAEVGETKNITKNKDYKVEDHLQKGTDKTVELFQELRDYITELGDNVVESPRKFYVAYRVIRNFICLEIHKAHLLLYLRLNPEDIDLENKNVRNVSEIGHYGTGDIEVRVERKDNIDLAKELIEEAYGNSSS